VGVGLRGGLLEGGGGRGKRRAWLGGGSKEEGEVEKKGRKIFLKNYVIIFF
jgi:hypothetical protein